MNNNLINQIKQAFKTRYSKIVYKIRRLTNPQYIRTAVFAKTNKFFRSLFDFKPKDKDDYYTILKWQVSKRLAYLIVVAIGLFSFMFLYRNYTNLVGDKSAEGIKTYSYKSVLLKFAKGNVRITGDSGYTAYEGTVSKGAVNGIGVLYDIDGNVVYRGNFENNDYSGEGKLFYPNGNVKYRGSFSKNVYEGTGDLFRQNGSKLYSGSFVNGIKEGEGILFDNSSTEIFSGNFSNDEIMYSDLVGKSTEDIASSYKGNRIVYEGEEIFDVHMTDIDALYECPISEDTLDESVGVDTVYVLKQTIKTPNGEISTPQQLRLYFGSPLFTGHSKATMGESIAIDEVISMTGEDYFEYRDYDTTPIYDDYYTVDYYDDSQLYLEAYSYSGMLYTFVSRDIGEPFGFYFITKEDGSADE